MKIKTLTAALACALPVTGAFAAALDRSGQSISAFLQPGNYAEISLSVLDPDVAGKSTPATGSQNISDMADDYAFGAAAIKVQPTDHFSFGLLYDQPFGAKAGYTDSSLFTDAALGNTEVSVDTHSLTAIFGFQPNANWNFYGGPVYQTIEGDVKLRGLAYGGSATGFGAYDAKIDETGEFGWLAGAAFQIPDIALKASVTYRSEVEHESVIEESFGASALSAIAAAAPAGKTDITTPQSVNLDLQTGIMANTVAFANVRWVNWKDFSIQPNDFGFVSKHPLVVANTEKADGFDLVAYTDDQWSVNAGVGRKLNDQWSGSVSVGWDSGAGNPVTTLGPTEGYVNAGIGIQYSPAANYFVQGGVKYFWLGDAKAQPGSQFDTENYVADFEDNTAIAYGLKLGYRF